MELAIEHVMRDCHQQIAFSSAFGCPVNYILLLYIIGTHFAHSMEVMFHATIVNIIQLAIKGTI